jgi:NADPH-dependent 2,4-dienoyl-CoA reductase/sulfur reductase-like enzyme
VNHVEAIRSQLAGRPSADILIVGGGFIGSEVAATFAKQGHRVTVVDGQPLPLSAPLGEELSRHIWDTHKRNGVQLRFAATVTEAADHAGEHRVRLSSGEDLHADVVVLGLGVRPNVAWLDGSSIPVDDGVVCDARCAVIDHEDVVAVGDVCRWYHPGYQRLVRVEHWDNAIRQAEAATATLLGKAVADYAPIPFFWTDQFDIRLQMLGRRSPEDTFDIVEGSLREGSFEAHFHSAGQIRAIALVNRAASLAAARSRLTEALKWA